jgi:hypothetical protein
MATTTDFTFFFDTFGGLWMVCDADHPEAEAFGPAGCARPVDMAKVGLVGDENHRTAFAAAARDGRVLRGVEAHEVDLLLFPAHGGGFFLTPTPAQVEFAGGFA